ncbi:DUF397 domain-containing protein [Phytohabitans sp. ZYX-F-186]|uniref:DUF397 domain-containing protein n=1 Tax=Phytohabitans maris TaxID=3071409 RepID=A0ABU0ZP18_9ACTN|nr:DUF397 domain-containing protein [Phytohabitans sp. ZYX-F-186]MDQ7907672.1 DUF397 domain-containing protein [Phytohabitans sp. ZYX-F-186]
MSAGHRISWRTSSRSQNTNCVEISEMGTAVAMRDSKDREGPVLIFARERWIDFVASAKAGEFDLN